MQRPTNPLHRTIRTIRSRYYAGESIADLAYDYDLTIEDVRQHLLLFTNAELFIYLAERGKPLGYNAPQNIGDALYLFKEIACLLHLGEPEYFKYKVTIPEGMYLAGEQWRFSKTKIAIVVATGEDAKQPRARGEYYYAAWRKVTASPIARLRLLMFFEPLLRDHPSWACYADWYLG
jgi:hypothetical protein